MLSQEIFAGKISPCKSETAIIDENRTSFHQSYILMT